MNNTMNGVELGQRVKQLRVQKGLTLKMIEASVGVSATHVSEVERGRTSPTVGALCKIASALGVNPSYLIDFPIGQAVSVTRPGERLVVGTPDRMFEAEVLTQQQPYAEITSLVVTVQPGTSNRFVRGAHPGDKFLYILEGLLEVTFGSNTYVLHTGDSLHFKATLPQEMRNLSEGPCRILWADWPRFKL